MRSDVEWIPRFWRGDDRFSAIAPVAECFADAATFPSVHEVDAKLATRAGIHFVAQTPRPRRRRQALDRDGLYDARIAREGNVPTREGNWHDFLNALVWATFPRAKWALHQRQHRAIHARIDDGATRLPPARTRELDALAILDEGGAILVCNEANDALARDRVRHALVFGHAVYESFVRGGPALTLRAAVLEAPTTPIADDALLPWADAALAALLDTPGTFTAPDWMPHWELSA